MFGPRRGWEVLPRAIGIYVVSGLLTVLGVLTVIREYLSGEVVTLLFYTFMDVVVPLAALGVGVYVARSDLSRRDVGTVTAWFVGGVVVLWGLYLWATLPELLDGTSLVSRVEYLVLYGNLGGALGLVAGLNRARARQNRRLADRTVAQQHTLEFLNHLLRHNVLNGLQIIGGYTDLLTDHVDDEGEEYLDRIDERNDHMSDLVDNVRVLMQTLSAEIENRPTDLSRILRSEMSVARTAYPDATFEVDVPDGVVVSANPTLSSVLENVLTNAVEHGGASPTRVAVSVSSDHGTATVRVADDGPGIPDRLKRAYVDGEPPNPERTGERLGLYLVSTLVDQFGGTVDVRDADPRGTVVRLRLPLADRQVSGPVTGEDRGPADGGRTDVPP